MTQPRSAQPISACVYAAYTKQHLLLCLWSLSHFLRLAWMAALSVQADQQWTCFHPGLLWILCSSPQTPRCYFLIASRARRVVEQLMQVGYTGSPCRKGAAALGGAELQVRRPCVPRDTGSMARKAPVLLQEADPVGLVSAQVSPGK